MPGDAPDGRAGLRRGRSARSRSPGAGPVPSHSRSPPRLHARGLWRTCQRAPKRSTVRHSACGRPRSCCPRPKGLEPGAASMLDRAAPPRLHRLPCRRRLPLSPLPALLSCLRALPPLSHRSRAAKRRSRCSPGCSWQRCCTPPTSQLAARWCALRAWSRR